MAKLFEDDAENGYPAEAAAPRAVMLRRERNDSFPRGPQARKREADAPESKAAQPSPEGTVYLAAPVGATTGSAAAGLPSPLNDEVTFVSGLNPDGTLAFYSYAAWNGDKPATYTGGYTLALKWGADAAGTPGGAVAYYFDSSWSDAERQVFTSGLALWSAEANISFYQTGDSGAAQIKFNRNSSGKASTSWAVATPEANTGLTDGTILYQLTGATISIDTSVGGFGPIDGGLTAHGGYPWLTVIHEEGHALGLGHAGPYNTTAAASQQYGTYDTARWSVMSYFNNVSGFGGAYPITPMIADILALQRLYGAPASTPLSGGQVFGFNTNITGDLQPFFDFTINTKPVITIWDAGTGNTLDLSGYSTASTVSLAPGTLSSVAGLTDNLGIAFDTAIDTLVCGTGNDVVTCSNDGNTVYGGSGNDTLTGGTGNDALYGASGNNTLTGGTGTNTIVGGSGNDTIYDSGAGSSIDGGGGNDSVTLDRSAMAMPMDWATGDWSTTESLPDGTQVTNVRTFKLISGAQDDSIQFNLTYLTGGPSMVYDGGGFTWDAGAGNDTATVDLSAALSVINAGYSNVPTYFVRDWAGDLIVALVNVESIRVYGGSNNDTLAGGDGNDRLSGGNGNDTLTGGSGNDTLDGGAGTNIINGMDGTDTAVYSGAHTAYTIVYGAGGAVTISGGGQTDTLSGVEWARFSDITIALGEMAMPTLDEEVTYITGVNSDGTIASTSSRAWKGDSPATYNTTGILAGKWGTQTAGTAGGTVFYYFNPASSWSATEQLQITATLALWSAMANITFVETTDSGVALGGIKFTRGSGGTAYADSHLGSTGPGSPGVAGGTKIWKITSSEIVIDTGGSGFGPFDGSFSTAGGYPWSTLLHEIGHALGLGHGGPYNDGDGGPAADSRQYSVYDSQLYSLMSYIDPRTTSATNYASYPVTGTQWGYVNLSGSIWAKNPVTPMPLDILAVQRLYGTPSGATTLTVGHTFGFNTDITGALKNFYDFTVNTAPVVTIWDSAANNTLDLSGFTSASTVNLNPGTYSSAGTALASNGSTVISMVNNIAIAYATAINTLITGGGADTVTLNDNGDIVSTGGGADTIKSGAGNDTIDGGDGTDSVVYTSNRATYSVSRVGLNYRVTGSQGTDSLSNVENLTFSDGTYSISSLAHSLTANDYNADGIDDILFQNSDGTLGIWQMNGTTVSGGGAVTTNPGTAWKALGFGDFNGDGKSDILFQNTDGTPAIWLMNGTTIAGGGALASNPGAAFKVIGSGDFNGDGKSDILFQNSDGTPGVWLMNGTAIVSGAVTSNPGATWKAIGAGDFNGDGKADILFQNSDGSLGIWLMSGTTVTSGTVVSSNPGVAWKAIGTGDFNGDGKADILFQNTDGTPGIWLMNGTAVAGGGALSINPGTAWKAITAEDFNGDGKADILFQNSDGTPGIWLMNGTTITSAAALASNPGSSWREVSNTNTTITSTVQARSDFNGDGKSDILFQNSDGTPAIWLMNGTTVSGGGALATNPGVAWKVIGSGDFNGDGKSDILFQNTDGTPGIWLMNGTGMTGGGAVASNPGATWKAISSGDFNADGKADILFQNSDGSLGIWLMNGAAVIGGGVVASNPGAAWKAIGTGDFNGDSKADILMQNTDGTVAVWLMNGTTVAGGGVVGTNPGVAWKAIGTGDFNGDGKADILFQNSDGTPAIWLMNGTTVSGGGALSTNPGTAWKAIGAEDFNGDGKSDILFQNTDGTPGVWIMNGTSLTSSSALSPNPGTSWHVVAG